MTRSRFFAFSVFLLYGFVSYAQERRLVWSDQFDGSSIDNSVWSFETGPSNDNVHFYTSRSENSTVVDGKLQLIALREAYSGYNFTSALIHTKKSLNWRYGRIEARIKLPASIGFVPAFWLLPADDRYGWWPYSGEIDIMEHPTNFVSQIYGTVHTGAYNSFTGSEPKGRSIEIPDAETQFHIYAIEWSKEKIDFYVDDQKYFTFTNDHSGPGTWPFDHPFYIILNLAVGGGWVGNPDDSSIFPAVMEIDYVNVYQYLNDMSIIGDDFVVYNSPAIPYCVPDIAGAEYGWKVPAGARIVSGENSNQILVDFGIPGGDITNTMTTADGSVEIKLPVRVSSNLIKNPGFEHGVKYWNKSAAYPAKAAFVLTNAERHSGKSCVKVTVENLGSNVWDISFSNPDILLEKGKEYHLSFWAKTENESFDINASVMNPLNWNMVGHATFSLNQNWSQYQLDFTPTETHIAPLNIDLGSSNGICFFDDFTLTTDDLSALNMVKNGDFCDGNDPWILGTGWPALATDTVIDGACNVSVQNEGLNLWDINLSQSGLRIQQGKEYVLTFDASADASRQFSAFIGKNSDPWTVYSGSNMFSASSDWQSYELSFIMQEPTDENARIVFDLGTYPETITFDNVILYERTVLSALNTNEATGKFIEIFPNPVKSITTINYDLVTPSLTHLKIFNEQGVEVASLAQGFEAAGEHSVTWEPGNLPPGVYFIFLRAGDQTYTRKVILLQN